MYVSSKYHARVMKAKSVTFECLRHCWYVTYQCLLETFDKFTNLYVHFSTIKWFLTGQDWFWVSPTNDSPQHPNYLIWKLCPTLTDEKLLKTPFCHISNVSFPNMDLATKTRILDALNPFLIKLVISVRHQRYQN